MELLCLPNILVAAAAAAPQSDPDQKVYIVPSAETSE